MKSKKIDMSVHSLFLADARIHSGIQLMQYYRMKFLIFIQPRDFLLVGTVKNRAGKKTDEHCPKT